MPYLVLVARSIEAGRIMIMMMMMMMVMKVFFFCECKGCCSIPVQFLNLRIWLLFNPSSSSMLVPVSLVSCWFQCMSGSCSKVAKSWGVRRPGVPDWRVVGDWLQLWRFGLF